MPDIFELVKPFARFGHTNIKILIVVDGSIRTVETPTAFGIGRVARLIDDLSRGCSSFEVDTARRTPHPLADENVGHISTNFDFDDTVNGDLIIDDYDQIWLFGIRGEGSGTLSNGELAALTTWMNDGGGLFATGDHADLGAGMCAGIPRVREMRRWTAADGVPPIGGFNRLDTNRPENAAEASGMLPMEFAHERDTTPQAIDWVPMSSINLGNLVIERPHEVLCHPQLGPINVMPDHPHEGRTKELSEVNLGRTYNFGGGVSGNDFPSSGANQPQPVIIARGETVAAPPTSKPYKGNAGYFEFPMISLYDGRSVGVKGRVATDSTWHHWFDLNIYELEHATDNTAWRKIARYFENLAVWLSPPGRYREKCWFFDIWLDYPLVEEFDLRKFDVREATPELGRLVRSHFTALFGPCSTTRLVWDICDLVPQLCRRLKPFDPRLPIDPLGPVCLTCPPFERLEEAVFEGIMLGTISFMEEHADEAEKVAKLSDARLEREMNKHFAAGIERSVTAYASSITAELKQQLKTWDAVAGTKPRTIKPKAKSKPRATKAKSRSAGSSAKSD